MALTVKQADKMMELVGYVRGMEYQPGSPEHECWYSNADIEQFSICIMIRLHDENFKFQYKENGTQTLLTTSWMSPIRKKRIFMERFNEFVEDARWFAQKYKGKEAWRR